MVLVLTGFKTPLYTFKCRWICKSAFGLAQHVEVHVVLHASLQDVASLKALQSASLLQSSRSSFDLDTYVKC